MSGSAPCCQRVELLDDQAIPAGSQLASPYTLDFGVACRCEEGRDRLTRGGKQVALGTASQDATDRSIDMQSRLVVVQFHGNQPRCREHRTQTTNRLWAARRAEDNVSDLVSITDVYDTKPAPQLPCEHAKLSTPERQRRDNNLPRWNHLNVPH